MRELKVKYYVWPLPSLVRASQDPRIPEVNIGNPFGPENLRASSLQFSMLLDACERLPWQSRDIPSRFLCSSHLLPHP